MQAGGCELQETNAKKIGAGGEGGRELPEKDERVAKHVEEGEEIVNV